MPDGLHNRHLTLACSRRSVSIDTPVRLQNSASAARIRSMTAAGSAPAKWGNRTCTGLFDQPGLCLYPVDHAPNGPFISGNWAAYVPTETYEPLNCASRTASVM